MEKTFHFEQVGHDNGTPLGVGGGRGQRSREFSGRCKQRGVNAGEGEKE